MYDSAADACQAINHSANITGGPSAGEAGEISELPRIPVVDDLEDLIGSPAVARQLTAEQRTRSAASRDEAAARKRATDERARAQRQDDDLRQAAAKATIAATENAQRVALAQQARLAEEARFAQEAREAAAQEARLAEEARFAQEAHAAATADAAAAQADAIMQSDAKEGATRRSLSERTAAPDLAFGEMATPVQKTKHASVRENSRQPREPFRSAKVRPAGPGRDRNAAADREASLSLGAVSDRTRAAQDRREELGLAEERRRSVTPGAVASV